MRRARRLEQPGPARFGQPVAREATIWREAVALGSKVLVIVIGFILVFTLVYGVSRAADSDMYPMVKDGDVALFFRLGKSYAAGDLVVLDFQGTRQVRRVAAIAGDSVDFGPAGLIINGSVQQEPDNTLVTRRYDSGVEFPLVVGPGQVFVLGDARENSTDSRVYGLVDEKDTLGSVITIIRRRNF